MAAISTRPAEPFSLITNIGLDDYSGFQEHTCAMIGATMAEFHNIMIRSLTSVYKTQKVSDPAHEMPRIYFSTADSCATLWEFTTTGKRQATFQL